MPALSVPDMIAAIRDIVDDESGNTHSDAEMVTYINSAVSYYDAFLAEFAETALMQFRDITHDGSELQDVMPYLPRIVSIERTSDDPRTETIPLPRGFADRFPFISKSAGTIPGYYYVQNNQLAIVPFQSSPGVDRVWVVLRSPELHYGTTTAASSTTSLVLDSTPTAGNIQKLNDAYNMIPVMITTAAIREINVINDYTGSTYTCTLQRTFENNPASSTYSLLPVIDPEFHWLFVWHPVILCRMRTQESTIEAVSERTRLESLLLQRIRSNQKQRARYFTRHGF